MSTPHHKVTNAPYRVAIFSTTNHGNTGQILRGLSQANAATSQPLELNLHTALGADRDKIRPVARQLLEEEQLPHVVMTIGAVCTQAYVEVAAEMEVGVLLIYIASAGVGPRLSSSLMPMVPSTGIELVKGDMQKAAQFLWEAKPHMKRLLIPYLPGGIVGYLDHESAIIKDFFTERGVQVSMLPVYSVAHCYELICSQLPSHDTLFLLEGGVAIERHRAFAYECIRHKVTLFSCISDGPTFGSVLGYGMDFSELGQKAFSYAQQVTYDSVDPSQLPVVTVPDKRVCFGNASLTTLQGLAQGTFEDFDKNFDVSVCEPAEVLSYLKPR
jgi:hypothetical protein